MAYRINYESEADVLTIMLNKKGKLSHAEEIDDVVVHMDRDGKPLFLEILRPARSYPLWLRR